MTQTPLYTIGYGSRTIEEFVELLLRYQIEYLVDIRSKPYSRFKPEFVKDTLSRILERATIRYIFMGNNLGGLPDDASLYTHGKVDYAQYGQHPVYCDGIQRLQVAWQKQLRVVLMCSESKPQECHRSKLIGETLHEEGIEVLHIDENGEIKTQYEVIQQVAGQPSLFPLSFTSRKRYRSKDRSGHDDYEA